jgi:hypothetical protein
LAFWPEWASASAALEFHRESFLPHDRAWPTSHHPSRSSSTPDEPRHSIRCQWDGGRGCGSSIGTSPARISAHLRTGHDIYCTKAYRDELTACRWGNCTALLKRANMIKHLGNHFGTLRVLCLYCGRSLARLDSLRRHTKACRVAPSQSRGGRTSDFRNAAPPISDCRSTSSTST